MTRLDTKYCSHICNTYVLPVSLRSLRGTSVNIHCSLRPRARALAQWTFSQTFNSTMYCKKQFKQTCVISVNCDQTVDQRLTATTVSNTELFNVEGCDITMWCKHRSVSRECGEDVTSMLCVDIKVAAHSTSHVKNDLPPQIVRLELSLVYWEVGPEAIGPLSVLAE